MRTHGAKELGDTLKMTPKRQLQPVFEVSISLSPLPQAFFAIGLRGQ